MALDYQRRLENLKSRRFDPDLNKSILTESFTRTQIPEDLKYLAESMHPIEKSYNDKTTTAANNVRNHLERDLQLSFSRNYRYQGSVMTKTNIRTHSDIDLLTIIDSYYYHNKPTSENVYAGNPQEDIKELRKQIVQILHKQYDEVDDTGSKSVAIYNKNLRRKVDIVPCYWYNSEPYEANKDEYYRGVWLYDFDAGRRTKIDFPFAHIRVVEQKGDSTFDGSRRGIRLIKNLKADSDDRIKLSSFQLTTIVHQMENELLHYSRGMELRIAENVSSQIGRLINDPEYRRELRSPNGTEKPMAKDECASSLSELKKDLDQLIVDCRSDLRNKYFEKAMLDYSVIN